MALFLPVGGVRVPSPPMAMPKLGHRRYRVSAAAANTSSPSRSVSDGTVDWVDSTSDFFRQDSRPIMLFDGVCNLCNGGVKFVRDHDQQRCVYPPYLPPVFASSCMDDEVDIAKNKKLHKRIRFEALQSEAGKKLLRRAGRAPDDISSVVLVEKERSYIKSEAVLKIMEYIDLPFPQLAFFVKFVPLFVRDFAYDNVANNRYVFFGRSESCEI